MRSRRQWYKERYPRAAMIQQILLISTIVIGILCIIVGSLFFIKNNKTRAAANQEIEQQLSAQAEEGKQKKPVELVGEPIATGTEEAEPTMTETPEATAETSQMETATETVETGAETTPESEEEFVIPEIPQRDYAVVVIDPGHGGKDGGSGTESIGLQVLEKDISLSVSKFLKEELESYENVEVYLTRDTDTFIKLRERPNIANEKQADLFVSIHCNTYEDDNSVRGLECYYLETEEQSRSYAEKMIASIKEGDRLGTRIRGTRTGDFAVFHASWYPAVLFEMGFLTNPEEGYNLTTESYQRLMAQVLAEAIYEVVGK